MGSAFGFIRVEKYNKRQKVEKGNKWRDRFKSKKSIGKQKVVETSAGRSDIRGSSRRDFQ